MSSLGKQKPEARSRTRVNLFWFLVSGLCFLASGCGFHSVYGKQTNTAGAGDSAQLASVRIDPVGGRMGQEFKQDLEDIINPGDFITAAPAYHLAVKLSTSEAAIGTSRDGTVSRYNIYLDSSYTLTRIADNQQVTSGNVRHVSSYNNLINDYFSTYVSEQDATTRGIAELAEIYRGRLAAYFDAGAPVEKTGAPITPATSSAPFFPAMPLGATTNSITGAPINPTAPPLPTP